MPYLASMNLHKNIQTLAQTSTPKRSLIWYVGWGLLLVLLAASWQGADMRPMDL